jgi:hypothetical protein
MDFDIKKMSAFVNEKFKHVSAETFGWLAIMVIHSATIPSLLAVMAGLTDRMPSSDIVLLAWAGLALFFLKAAVQRDLLNLITIGIGFMIQAALMVLIFFK